jgi:peptidoglycan/LPS O-acetylase OafA/YrhL
MTRCAFRFGAMQIEAGMAAYRSDIDGLRALAVLSVVAFHGDVTGFSGGFTGVDIFFVISGYLLTDILLRELKKGTFTLTDFYVRRARRILPAVTVVVLACLVVGFYLMTPGQFSQTAQAAQSVATISANIFFAKIKADYWEQSSLADHPLLHTWSLAVEEQFYIVLPLILWVLHRTGTARHGDSARARLILLSSLALVAAGSLAYSQWLLKARPADAFYLMLPRAWELLTGSLLAIGLHRRRLVASSLQRDGAGFLGLSMIVISIVSLNESTSFPGIGALLPCLGAVLVIGSGCTGQGPVQMMLSLPPLVWVGKVSYSLYLWHWPVLTYINSAGWHAQGLPQIPLILQFVLMLILAWMSWLFIEQPFRRSAAPIVAKRRVLFISAASLAAIWASGSIADNVARTGWPLRQTTPDLLVQIAFDKTATPGLRCEGSDSVAKILYDGGGCLLGNVSNRPIFALVGDSHARMYTEAIEALASQHVTSVFIMARSSCFPGLDVTPPTRPECREFTRATIDYLLHSEIQKVVLAGYWIDLARDDAYSQELAEGLEKTVSKLTAAGKRVVLLKDVPELSDDNVAYRGAISSLRSGGAIVYGPSFLEHEKNQEPASKFLDEISRKYNAHVIDPTKVLCIDGRCIIANQNRSLYRDKHHLTDHAAAKKYKILESLFLKRNSE